MENDTVHGKRISKILTANEKVNLVTTEKLEKKYLRWGKQALNKWKKHIKIYKTFTIVYFKGENRWVGQYIDGTFKHPLIFIYLDEIKQDSRIDDGESLEANFKITIYHELGHALCEYQRKIGIKLIHQRKEEDFVERMARTIHYNRKLPAEFVLIDQLLCLIEKNKLKEKMEKDRKNNCKSK